MTGWLLAATAVYAAVTTYAVQQHNHTIARRNARIDELIAARDRLDAKLAARDLEVRELRVRTSLRG